MRRLQVFQSGGESPAGVHGGQGAQGGGHESALYAIDWSYPRSRSAPSSIVLKRWGGGGASPPEYVAVYRLRGTAPAHHHHHRPSYSLAHDEVRHYPWDSARRFHAPRWSGSPRDEDFELIPAGSGSGLRASGVAGGGSVAAGGLAGGGVAAGGVASMPAAQQPQYMFRTL